MNMNVPLLMGAYVGIEPLAGSHEAELKAAADDPTLWPYMFRDGSGEGFAEWWREAVDAHDAGNEVVFVVREQESGRVVGSTRYINIAPAHLRLEIGHTWYERAAWGSNVNPECKLLLMTHAFEALGYNRVELRCDSRNARSWEAIKRLGAIEEGILRRHMVVQNGYVRDTVQFSVLLEEWPRVQKGLEARVKE
jgi:RimJ/RimL family protein N-acetyltransferase